MKAQQKKERQDMRVINDPLGQTNGSANSCHCSCLNFVLFCEIVKSAGGRTDNTCENSDHYRAGLWVGLVDQKKSFSSTNDDNC